MATIIWTAEAQRWLEDIFEYIAADNPYIAAQTVSGIYKRALELSGYGWLRLRLLYIEKWPSLVWVRGIEAGLWPCLGWEAHKRDAPCELADGLAAWF